MKHLVYNCNGVRAVHRSGDLTRILLRHRPDVVALTEIKIGAKRLSKLKTLHSSLRALGYAHCYWHPMTSGHGGLHGTALFFKQKPLRVLCGWAHTDANDGDGRVITAIFDTHILLNTYIPCSTWPAKKIAPDKAAAKDQRRRDFDALLSDHCEFLQRSLGIPLIHVGDMNVTATDADYTVRRQFADEYPGNKPWERAAFHARNKRLRLVDAWRHFHPTVSEDDLTHFENERHWRSGQGQRLDYVLVPTDMLSPKDPNTDLHISDIQVDQFATGSDHCPIVFTLENVRNPGAGKRPLLPLAPLHVNSTKAISDTAPKAATPDPFDFTAFRDVLPTLPGIAEATAALPAAGDLSSLAAYDVEAYPACLSNPEDAAFDRFADRNDSRYDTDSHYSVTDRRQAEIAELRSCSSVTQTVPVSNASVTRDGQTSIRVLWDSGASYTTLSRKGLAALRRGGVECPTQAAGADAPSFILADGRVSRPSAQVIMPLYFGEERILQRAWLMDGGSFDAILGVDFFVRVGATLSFARQRQEIVLTGLQGCPKVTFDIAKADTFRGAVSPIVAQQAFAIPARKRCIAPLGFLPSDPMAGAQEYAGMIEKFGGGRDARHCMATALSVARDGHVNCELSNFTDNPVVVPRGALLGYFRPMENVDSNNLEETKKFARVLEPQPLRSANCAPIFERKPADDDVFDVSDTKRQYLNAVFLDELVPPEEDDPLNEDGIPTSLEGKLAAAKEVLTESQYERLVNVIKEFADVFARDYKRPPKASHEPMRLGITGNPKPVLAKQARHGPKERNIITEYCTKLLQNGVLEHSTSPWRSRLLLVPKKDSGFRVVCDLRSVNALTTPIASNMPSLADNLDLLGGKKIFSTFDILSAFWSCELYEPDRKYTAFFAPGIGNLQFKRAAMGLTNAGTHFVQLTLNMFSNLLFDYVAAYADDVLVFSSDVDEHIDVHLPAVLQRFRDYNVKLKGSKAELCVTSLDWCGYRISTDGLSMDPKKVAAIRDMEDLTTLRQLRSFLGSCNFLRRWIPRYSDIVEPLRPLLQKGRFRKRFTEEQQAAVQKLKDIICDAPVLAHPRFDRPFRIYCDASKVALGAALCQCDDDGTTVVIAYLSKSLSDTQKGYHANELEALSVLFALETWSSYFFGQKQIDVLTDSHAACWLFKPESKYLGRMLRWTLRASRWPVKLHHLPGATNKLADMLSRCPSGSSSQTPRHEPEPLMPAYAHAITRSQTSHRRTGDTAGPAQATPNMHTAGSRTTAKLKGCHNCKGRHVNGERDCKEPCRLCAGKDHTRYDCPLRVRRGHEDAGRTRGSPRARVKPSTQSTVTHNPWESIFPGCEFEDDMLALRPDIVL